MQKFVAQFLVGRQLHGYRRRVSCWLLWGAGMRSEQSYWVFTVHRRQDGQVHAVEYKNMAATEEPEEKHRIEFNIWGRPEDG